MEVATDGIKLPHYSSKHLLLSDAPTIIEIANGVLCPITAPAPAHVIPATAMPPTAPLRHVVYHPVIADPGNNRCRSRNPSWNTSYHRAATALDH